ncbi:hypothetical protein BN130_3343 [Cronobacter malonaticus 507]|nr:hypothetical protein BN130_3343 [Cronobacter malonaticus 507]
MTPAHIERIVQQLLIVGADIQHDRQRIRRADAAAGGVERELADRNPHAADALVAEAENTLAVGHHDHFDVMDRHVLQDVIHVVAVRPGDEHPAGAAVNFRKTFAGRAHRRGVDDGHHHLKMVFQQAIKQGFVGVLDVAQVNVFINIRFEIFKLSPRTLRLLFNGFHHFRQQPQQVEIAALFHAEGAALVQQRELQQNGAGVGNVKRTVFFVFDFHLSHSFLRGRSLTIGFLEAASERADYHSGT